MMPLHAPYEPLVPGDIEVQPQILDEDRLGNTHDWSLAPCTNLQFRENVEMESHPRADIARYKLIAQSNRTIAKNLFSILCRSTTLFKIPDTIFCSRTFARDAEEAYYINAMDAYLSKPPGDLDVREIPLLQGSLRNRMFCAFNRKPGYRSELYHRRRLGRWLPSDAPENRHFEDATLAGSYPRCDPWVKEIYQPPALAVPLQFAIYYYHQELRDAQVSPLLFNPERIRRLLFCVRKEHYILIMAMWWNDVCHGGRMYVLEGSTIDVFDSECGTVEDIAGMPAQALIAHMRIVAGLPSIHHNWMCLSDNSMEPSIFVWGIKETGGLDTSRPSGMRFYCGKEHRKVSTSKYGCALLRQISIMDQRLSIPELDKIEGLLGLVEEREWQAHGSLRVCDLVHHLLDLYRRGNRAVDNMRRDLECAEGELRSRNRSFDDMRNDFEDIRQRLRDAKDRIRYHDNHMDHLKALLRDRDNCIDDMKKKIDAQSRELQDLRSTNILRSVPGYRAPSTQQVSQIRNPYHGYPNPAGSSNLNYNPAMNSLFSRSQVIRPNANIPNSSTQPARVNDLNRPKRRYPFFEMPQSARKR